MCIIIDTCSLSKVFNINDSGHEEFKPVLDWILFGRGKVIFGGEKYRAELTKSRRYRRLFEELLRKGKALSVNHYQVNSYQEDLIEKVVHRDFDDPHLVAMVAVTGCKLICTKERRAIPFLRRSDLYPKHIKRPKIYLGKKNIKILCDKYIAECCKPVEKTKKSTAEKILGILPNK